MARDYPSLVVDKDVIIPILGKGGCFGDRYAPKKSKMSKTIGDLDAIEEIVADYFIDEIKEEIVDKAYKNEGEENKVIKQAKKDFIGKWFLQSSSLATFFRGYENKNKKTLKGTLQLFNNILVYMLFPSEMLTISLKGIIPCDENDFIELFKALRIVEHEDNLDDYLPFTIALIERLSKEHPTLRPMFLGVENGKMRIFLEEGQASKKEKQPEINQVKNIQIERTEPALDTDEQQGKQTVWNPIIPYESNWIKKLTLWFKALFYRVWPPSDEICYQAIDDLLEYQSGQNYSENKLQYFISNDYRYFDGATKREYGLENYLWDSLVVDKQGSAKDHKYFFLLSESGGGKTTSLLRLLYLYTRSRYKLVQNAQLIFIEFGDPNFDQKLKDASDNLKREQKRRKQLQAKNLKCILLLDALDEDLKVLHEDQYELIDKVHSRLEDLKPSMDVFDKVIISSRRHFFENSDGLKKVEMLFGSMVCTLLIFPFSQVQARQYLTKKYGHTEAKDQAIDLFNKFSSEKKLLSTHLLISYMDYLLRLTDSQINQITTKAELIELVVLKWSEAEEEKVRNLGLLKDNRSKIEYAQLMMQSAIEVAKRSYLQSSQDVVFQEDGLSPDSHEAILAPYWDNRTLFKGRHFFTHKENSNRIVFTHKVLREFFVAKAAYEQVAFDRQFDFDFSDVSIDGDNAESLYMQLFWVKRIEPFFELMLMSQKGYRLIYYRKLSDNEAEFKTLDKVVFDDLLIPYKILSVSDYGYVSEMDIIRNYGIDFQLTIQFLQERPGNPYFDENLYVDRLQTMFRSFRNSEILSIYYDDYVNKCIGISNCDYVLIKNFQLTSESVTQLKKILKYKRTALLLDHCEFIEPEAIEQIDFFEFVSFSNFNLPKYVPIKVHSTVFTLEKENQVDDMKIDFGNNSFVINGQSYRVIPKVIKEDQLIETIISAKESDVVVKSITSLNL